MWSMSVTLGGGITMTYGSLPPDDTDSGSTWKYPASFQER